MGIISVILPVRPLIRISFPLILSVFTNVRLYCDSLLVYIYVCWSEFLSLFFWRILLLFGYKLCDWLYVYMYVSLSLSLWASGYIIGNLHVYEQARSVRSACNCAIYIFSLHFAWILSLSLSLSLDSYFFLSLCLWMCVAVSGYIIPHCMCKCTSLDACFSLTFSLNVFILFRIYCH